MQTLENVGKEWKSTVILMKEMNWIWLSFWCIQTAPQILFWPFKTVSAHAGPGPNETGSLPVLES